MLFDKYFIPEVTPERVYALLKLVKSGQYSKDDLRDLILPKELNKSQDEFNSVFRAAANTDLIKVNELNNIIECKVTDIEIDTVDKYRRYMSKLASSNNNLFIQFTSWYISQNQSVFFYKTAEEFSSRLTGQYINMDKKLVLGWRFWASFLGYGYLHEVFLIPNMCVRISDALYMDRLITNTSIGFSAFMEHITRICPEIQVVNKDLSIALSNGLRSLHDSGKIKLIYTPDSNDVWHLFRIESHEIHENVTDIIIKEGLYE
jgi:hypothetical protein